MMYIRTNAEPKLLLNDLNKPPVPNIETFPTPPTCEKWIKAQSQRQIPQIFIIIAYLFIYLFNYLFMGGGGI